MNSTAAALWRRVLRLSLALLFALVLLWTVFGIYAGGQPLVALGMLALGCAALVVYGSAVSVAWPLTSIGSYCMVFDTVIEDIPDGYFTDRPWGPGNNPKTAVWEYLKTHPEFEIDKSIQNKLLITVAPDGYLKRVR